MKFDKILVLLCISFISASVAMEPTVKNQERWVNEVLADLGKIEPRQEAKDSTEIPSVWIEQTENVSQCITCNTPYNFTALRKHYVTWHDLIESKFKYLCKLCIYATDAHSSTMRVHLKEKHQVTDKWSLYYKKNLLFLVPLKTLGTNS